MIIKYNLLYKSGKEDVLTQEANESEHAAMAETIEKGFRQDLHGVLTFSDGEGQSTFVRLSDLSRANLTVEDDHGK
ncbi:hypothetical protein KYJ26_20305 [Bacillus sp. MCCB 382]|uniref:hypothetical protein n=1 Tax=Bacillus sp. MCCB 382 TaxID=2860197 RepID=UPI001C5A2F30|nr:hypothetical protein [Bacillus sp. MCCB 382]